MWCGSWRQDKTRRLKLSLRAEAHATYYCEFPRKFAPRARLTADRGWRAGFYLAQDAIQVGFLNWPS
jgi:hypothetical protein